MPVLSTQRFDLSWVDLGEQSIVFTRASDVDGLYEKLTLQERGRTREVLSAMATVSVVRHRPFWRGLGESRAIVDFANVPDRAETVVHSPEERTSWLTKVASVSPERCRLLASSAGRKVLGTTGGARNAARQYFECLPPGKSLHKALAGLERECSASVLDTIRVLLAGVAWTCWSDLFFLGCLIMARFGKDVEPEKMPLGTFPRADQDQEVMWRIILLVDLLISEFTSKRPVLLPPPWLFPESGCEMKRYTSAKA